MSLQDSTKLETVKIVMLKGEKGEQGAGTYDDTEVRGLITAEAQARASKDTAIDLDIAALDAIMDTAESDIDSLEGRMSTAENDINVLDARMDIFASLPSGSTSGNAELIDIRVGADGTTYSTAGGAVRGQISDLKDDIYFYSEPTAIGDWVTKYIKDDGTYGNSSLRVTSLPQDNSFLPKRLVIQAQSGYAFYVAEYSATSSSSFVGFIGGTAFDAQVDTLEFTPVASRYYGICASKKDGTALTPSNIPDDCVTYRYKYYTDKNLVEENKAADAKVTGDKFGSAGRAIYCVDTLVDKIASDDNVIYSLTDIPLMMSTGYYIDINGEVQSIASTDYATSQAVSVSEGQIYIVHGSSTSGNSAFTILDASSSVLNHIVVTDAYGHDYRVVIPNGASSLIVAGNGAGISKASLKLINSIGLVASSLGDTKVGYQNLDTLMQSSFVKGSYNTNYTPSTPNENYLLNAGTGELTSYSDCKVSDMIDCSGWVSFKFSGKSYYVAACVAFYEKDGTCISTYPANGDTSVVSYNEQVFDIPSNAKYVRFGDNRGVVGGLFAVKLLSNIVPVGTQGVWTGKKWCAVGDSLTEVNSRTSKNYCDYISELTGISVVNMGRSGTGYKRTYDEGYAFYQRISSVPIDSDVVTIFGSGNDMTYVASSLGDVTDTGTTTLCGCINTTIDNLYAIMPTVHLGIITPCPWIDYPPTDLTNPMLKYSNKIVEICKQRGIPCLDLYHCSNLRPWDSTFRTLAYSHDEGNGVHPDETGHKLIAGMIQQFVASLFIPV